MNLINLIKSKLEELGLKVYWQRRPDTFPSLTFFIINESGQDFADDKELSTSITCQVDVWSKNDYTELVEQVKTKMKEIEFYRSSEYDDFEEDVQVYHRILRFNYLQNN